MYTSDPAKSEFRIKLMANVVEAFDSTTPVTIIPPRVNIPPDKRDGEFMFVMRNVTDEPVTLQLIAEQPGVLDIRLPEGELAPGEEKSMLVRVDEGFEKLAHKTSFTLEMSDENKTRFTVPVEIGTAGRPVTNRGSHKGTTTSSKATSTSADLTSDQVIRPTTTTGKDKKKDKGEGK